ncbi:MAG: MucR family transcriptional regulator [Dongiaceae bacterium]
MPPQSSPADLLPLVSEIVAAHLSNNQVPQADLPALIREVYQALASVGGLAPAAPERVRPAIPIARSVGQNEITCLACGEKMKMLKRHLRTAHVMTPRQYRDSFGLDADYPLVAPAYAKKRSKLAKSIGLGRQPKARKGRR